MASSLLVLSGDDFDLSEYSLRGLTATLSPITQSAQVQRDINGNALDLGAEQMKKYRLQISCTDQESPGFAAITTAGIGVWPGSLVDVTLLPQLGSATPLQLEMIVVEPWSESVDEWGASNAWQLTLEETGSGTA
jgi:hypothetical protein